MVLPIVRRLDNDPILRKDLTIGLALAGITWVMLVVLFLYADAPLIAALFGPPLIAFGTITGVIVQRARSRVMLSAELKAPPEPKEVKPHPSTALSGFMRGKTKLYYDFGPRRVVALLLMLRPRVTAKSIDAANPKPSARGYYISAAIQITIVASVAYGFTATDGVIKFALLVALLLYVCYAAWAFIMLERFRHRLSDIRFQLSMDAKLLHPVTDPSFPAKQFTQFYMGQTFPGWIFGYGEAVIRSEETTEILPGFRYVRYPKRMKAVLDYIEYQNIQRVQAARDAKEREREYAEVDHRYKLLTIEQLEWQREQRHLEEARQRALQSEIERGRIEHSSSGEDPGTLRD